MSRLCLSWPLLPPRSEEHTSELQSPGDLVCRLLLEKKKRAITSPRTRSRVNGDQQVYTRAHALASSLLRIASAPTVRPAVRSCSSYVFFFLNDRAPPEISPLPLPDALPI